MQERDWLIAVGILVIVAILLDAVRRFRNSSRDSLQISINMNRGIENRDLDEFAGDLPVRVIDKRDDAVKRGKPGTEPAAARTAGETPLSDTARKRQIDFEKTAPLLMDVKEGRPVRIEPGFASEDDVEDADEVMTEHLESDDEMDTEELYAEGNDSDLDDVTDDVGDDEDSPVSSELERTNPPARGVKNASPVFDSATTPLGLGESGIVSAPRVFDRPADMPPPRKEPPVLKPSKPVIKAIEERGQQPSAPQSPPAAPKPKQPEDVIVISVMARDSSGFPGAAMLEILLTNGLRYGHRNIFHRYTGDEREDEALFSVANAVKPGTFDLLNMESFHTPGITLFLPLPSPGGKAMDAFEAMLTTARQVAEQLNGDLRDDQRSALTGQSIEHCRQRIRDFEMQSRLRAR